MQEDMHTLVHTSRPIGHVIATNSVNQTSLSIHSLSSERCLQSTHSPAHQLLRCDVFSTTAVGVNETVIN